MENLLLPFKIEFNEGRYAEHRFGVYLSRVIMAMALPWAMLIAGCFCLLSLPGAAVEAFKIKGVQHEFSTMEGVKEDITEIMLNLKQLVVKVYSDEPVILNLIKKGSGAVTAKDIEKIPMEVINKDLVIANVTGAKNTLEMEITVGRGRGFSRWNKRTAKIMI